jgi:hypothetical protein
MTGHDNCLCRWGDSNPHSVRKRILSPLCLRGRGRLNRHPPPPFCPLGFLSLDFAGGFDCRRQFLSVGGGGGAKLSGFGGVHRPGYLAPFKRGGRPEPPPAAPYCAPLSGKPQLARRKINLRLRSSGNANGASGAIGGGVATGNSARHGHDPSTGGRGRGREAPDQSRSSVPGEPSRARPGQVR